MRWDSDHVVTLGDDLDAIAQELVRGGFLPRTHIGLDYFDASINRVAAWVIGTRNTLKALLKAMVEPIDRLRECEAAADYTARLALQEEIKGLPWGVVWDHYCATAERTRAAAAGSTKCGPTREAKWRCGDEPLSPCCPFRCAQWTERRVSAPAGRRPQAVGLQGETSGWFRLRPRDESEN